MKFLRLNDIHLLLTSLGFSDDNVRMKVLQYFDEAYFFRMMETFEEVYQNRLTITTYAALCFYLLKHNLNTIKVEWFEGKEEIEAIINPKAGELVAFMLSISGNPKEKDIVSNVLKLFKIEIKLMGE